jgi:predicted N-acetyltransferase YhbS
MTVTTAALGIRRLDPRDQDPKTYAALARLFADAYPILGVKTDEDLAHTVERLQRFAGDPGTANVIAERDGALVGAMRLYDYRMNVRGTDALTGGVGSVAVSLAHKRQGIARALLAWYLEDYHRRGAPFAVLHPFKLDFYRAIGFGYGTPVHRFRLAPATLRDAGARGTARFLDERDCDALLACYERVRAGTNGLIAKHRAVTERMLSDAALRYVGVEDGGTLRGFMQTTAAAAGDRLRNADELTVRDLTYEDEASLAALLGYLRAQRDQFARVAVESQDPAFYLVSDDPRDGSDLSVAPPAGHRVAETGLGPMYRILDVPGAFAHLPPSSASFTLRVDVEDPFFGPTQGAWTFRFGPSGPPQPQRDNAQAPDATLAIGIADLSGLVMGSLRLRDLVAHRLAALTPASRLEQVGAAFHTDQPPQCTTRF